jgi:hypothetical protein
MAAAAATVVLGETDCASMMRDPQLPVATRDHDVRLKVNGRERTVLVDVRSPLLDTRRAARMRSRPY